MILGSTIKRIFIYITTFAIFISLPTFGQEMRSRQYCLFHTKIDQKITPNISINFDLKTGTDRSGWTWVNPDWDGDAWPADYIVSPDKSAITTLPELYYKTCSYWQDFMGHCRIADSSFSEATGIVFVEGNKKNLFGFRYPESYAVYGDNIIILPSNMQRATRYRGDIVAHRLAALRGLNEELVLFDGIRTSSFPLSESQDLKNDLPSWTISNDPVTSRAFVHGNGAVGATMFLYEIVKGPELKEIDLDGRIKGWIELLSLPDHQTFIITRHGIFAETLSGFRRIAHFDSLNYIAGPADVGLTERGDISFPMSGRGDQKHTLVLSTSRPQCEMTINLMEDKSVSFDGK